MKRVLKKSSYGVAVVLMIMAANNYSVEASDINKEVIYYSDYNEFINVIEEADRVSAEQDEMQQLLEEKVYFNNQLLDEGLELIETEVPGVYIKKGDDLRNPGNTYRYTHYAQSSSMKNDKKFKIADLTYVNTTSLVQQHSFRMQEQKDTAWTVTGKVAGEFQLGNDLLAKTEASVGIDVDRNVLTSKGTQLTSNTSVPAYSTVDCVTYLKAGYSGGVAYYNTYSPGGTLIGQVSYTDQTAWSPQVNGYTVILTQR